MPAVESAAGSTIPGHALSLPFPRLSIWYPDPWRQPLAEIARYDCVAFYEGDGAFVPWAKALNPDLIAVTKADAISSCAPGQGDIVPPGARPRPERRRATDTRCCSRLERRWLFFPDTAMVTRDGRPACALNAAAPSPLAHQAPPACTILGHDRPLYASYRSEILSRVEVRSR